MMFEGWIKALQEVKGKRDEIVISSVKELEDFILNMNRAQMYSGIRNDGSEIKPAYTPFTVDIKTNITHQPTDRVTLKDTGDFYKAFTIVYSKDFFILYSRDPKTGALLTKYKDEIFGLTDKNLEKLIEKIKPIILEKINKMLEVGTKQTAAA